MKSLAFTLSVVTAAATTLAAAHAGPVAWNVSVGGGPGGVAFGFNVASPPMVAPARPVVVAPPPVAHPPRRPHRRGWPPRVVIAPVPVMVVPPVCAPGPVWVKPRWSGYSVCAAPPLVKPCR